MHTKRMVCLANSRKYGGRCIAGKELIAGRPGKWIRPISDRECGEVAECERQYEDGTEPCVLDIVDVPLLRPQPHSYQQENWLIDPNWYWVKAGCASWTSLQRLVDPVSPLWMDGYSSFTGSNDKIPLERADELRDSLRLISTKSLTLAVFAPGQAFGNPKRRVQARFRYAAREYRLWVTDPVYEGTYLERPDGEYPLGECFLTVSLGEPFEGYCYKLVAAIIQDGEGREP